MQSLLLAVLMIWCTLLGSTNAQLGLVNETCNNTINCVRPISHWKSANTVWPASYPENTTICGTAVGVILDAYNFVDCGATTPVSILGQLIWAKANEAWGSCRTGTAQNAINNLQSAVNSANAGDKSDYPYYLTNPNTNPTTGGCDGGWVSLEAALKRRSISVSLGDTLCKYNTGEKWGPCPCFANGTATDCPRLKV